MEVFLSRHWQKLSAGKDWLNLDQLLEWWTASLAVTDETNSLENGLASHNNAVEETNPPVHDRVGVFWALLLLSAQSKVELSQEEFYQELKIRSLE